MFKELRQDELMYVEGGGFPGPSQWLRVFTGIGECAANVITGFVEGCEDLADTCYSAGHDVGKWLAK